MPASWAACLIRSFSRTGRRQIGWLVGLLDITYSAIAGWQFPRDWLSETSQEIEQKLRLWDTLNLGFRYVRSEMK